MAYADDVVKSLSLSVKQFDSNADVDTALAAGKLAEGSFVTIRRPASALSTDPIADTNYANWFIVSKKFVDADDDGEVDMASAPIYVKDRATFGVQTTTFSKGIKGGVSAIGGQSVISVALDLKTGTPLKITNGQLDYKDISIAATSQSMLAYDAVTRELSVSSLATFDYVISTESTLAAFVANDGQLDSMRRGDIVFLPTGDLTYLCTYTGSGVPAETDFIQYETPQLAMATVRGWFGTETVSAMEYNPTTGKFKVRVATNAGIDIDSNNDLRINNAYVQSLFTGFKAILVQDGIVGLGLEAAVFSQDNNFLELRLKTGGGVLKDGEGLYLDPAVINGGITGVAPISYDDATQQIILAKDTSLKIGAGKLGLNPKTDAGIVVDASGVSLGGAVNSFAWALNTGQSIGITGVANFSAAAVILNSQLRATASSSWFKATDGKYVEVVFDATNNYYPSVLSVVDTLPA